MTLRQQAEPAFFPEHAFLVVDTRNAMKGIQGDNIVRR